ncbi:MAG: hypothetical protein JO081_10585 [Alphaproteobacteria bacterium]|nr:hypothetical protein [Alphaproteobacteria bacterium]
MRPASFFAFILITALTIPAFAQAPPAAPPTIVRGTIQKFADHTLLVDARGGKTVTVTLAPNFTVRTMVARTLADIKPGDKVGITSIKGPSDARQAIEIHILPANLPNLRLSEYPSDLRPGSLMTNAAVAQVSTLPTGQSIKVSLNGKESEITVPPDATIVGYGPGDPNLLRPGTAVVVFARKQADGSLAAPSVTAEKDGVKPPM